MKKNICFLGEHLSLTVPAGVLCNSELSVSRRSLLLSSAFPVESFSSLKTEARRDLFLFESPKDKPPNGKSPNASNRRFYLKILLAQYR